MYEAKRLGVKGWIRNLPDRRVEAVFEGEEEKVKKLITFSKRGPSGAKVENVEVIWENFKDEFRNFETKY